MSAKERKEPVRRSGVRALLSGCGDEKDMVRLRGVTAEELGADIESLKAAVGMDDGDGTQKMATCDAVDAKLMSRRDRQTKESPLMAAQ